MARVVVQEPKFDPGAVLNAFTAEVTRAGAVVSFSGITRDLAQDRLIAMQIEHYPGMTEKALGDIRDQAIDRFDLIDAMVLHRFGRLTPDEPIMMVCTAARHRAAAFQGAEFLMDYLKSRAPFWKQEITDTGATWVASKSEDEDALSRW